MRCNYTVIVIKNNYMRAPSCTEHQNFCKLANFKEPQTKVSSYTTA